MRGARHSLCRSSQPLPRARDGCSTLSLSSVCRELSRKGARSHEGWLHLQGHNAQKESNQSLEPKNIQSGRKFKNPATLSDIKAGPKGGAIWPTNLQLADHGISMGPKSRRLL